MRRAALMFVLVVVSAAAIPQGAPASNETNYGEIEEIVVPQREREELWEAFHEVDGPISDYLTAVKKPRRRLVAEQVGLRPSQLRDSRLLVVGPLSRDELSRLLAVHHFQNPLSKVVGDLKYARLYFGDPKKDPCCFGEWTFSRESGEWKRILEYWRSH